jgi:hypothetical protein
MGRDKKTRIQLSGAQLLAKGDIITVVDDGVHVKCRVISCLAVEDGSCMASLEIIDGNRAGSKMEALLKAGNDGNS